MPYYPSEQDRHEDALTEERTRIGNTLSCDLCGEQHGESDCPVIPIGAMTEAEKQEYRLDQQDEVHPALIPEIPAPTFIDITPVGCQTPEGVKRIQDAQQEWESATHLLANAVKEIMEDDQKPTPDDIHQLRVLIGARDRKQEAFLRAVAGR
jgi:hypothetical protein